MSFFYSDAKYDGPKLDLSRMDATKQYLKHYSNLLLLKVIMGDAKTSVVDKAQARKETSICERKLAYWARHHNYVHEDALRGMDKLKKEWGGRAG